MFNALSGKKYRDMVGLLEQGKTVEEVAEWLDVNPEYVAKHVPEKKTAKRKVTKG